MTTLELRIDARPAKTGAADFVRSADTIRRAAGDAKRSVDAITGSFAALRDEITGLKSDLRGLDLKSILGKPLGGTELAEKLRREQDLIGQGQSPSNIRPKTALSQLSKDAQATVRQLAEAQRGFFEAIAQSGLLDLEVDRLEGMASTVRALKSPEQILEFQRTLGSSGFVAAGLLGSRNQASLGIGELIGNTSDVIGLLAAIRVISKDVRSIAQFLVGRSAVAGPAAAAIGGAVGSAAIADELATRQREQTPDLLMAALLESVTRATALFERAATAESQTRREVIEILAQRQVDQAKDSADLLLGVRDTLSKQQSSNQEVTDAQKEQLQRIDALLEQVRPALERFGVTPTARMIDRVIDPNPAGIEGQGLAAEPIITDLTRAIDRLVRFLDEVFPLVPGTRDGPPLRPRTFGSAANFSDDRNNDLLINVADNNGKASLFNPTPQVIDEVAAPNLPPPPVRERPSILPETTTSEIFKVNDAARQLGFTFSSAFEDAVIAGRSFSDVLKGLGDDITRILLRLTVTQPLSNLITGFFSGAFGGTSADIGSDAGGGFADVLGRSIGGGGNALVAGAGGGLIRGPGTGTSDSILAALSDGEFVVFSNCQMVIIEIDAKTLVSLVLKDTEHAAGTATDL